MENVKLTKGEDAPLYTCTGPKDKTVGPHQPPQGSYPEGTSPSLVKDYSK